MHATRPPHHIPPQPDTGKCCSALQLQGRSCQGAKVPAHVRASAHWFKVFPSVNFRAFNHESFVFVLQSPRRCVLGNTTILAEFAGEEEVNRFFAQGQSLGGTTSWQATPGTNQTRMGGTGSGASHPIGHSPHWNNNNNGAGSNSSSGGLGAGGTKTGGELLWGGVQQYSSLWGPPSGEEGRVMGSPTPINTLLPGDLLSGESM